MFKKVDVDFQTSSVAHPCAVRARPQPDTCSCSRRQPELGQQLLDGLRRHFGENPELALVHLVEIITLKEGPREEHR